MLEGADRDLSQDDNNPISALTQVATGAATGNPYAIATGLASLLGLGGTGIFYRRKRKETDINKKLLETIDYLLTLVDNQNKALSVIKEIQGQHREDIRERLKHSDRRFARVATE